MRKPIAIIIAICLLFINVPVSSFAQHKVTQEAPEKKKTRKQRKAEKRQKKRWKRIRSRSNDFRYQDKHLGENKFERQTKQEQKKRSKHHVKP